MDFQQEVPTAPPPANKGSYPWKHRVSYKSGKVAMAFAAKAVPEDVKAGFSFFDSEQKVNVPLSQFRAIVVASLSGIAGVTKEGDKYYNYWSNLIKDTRQDVLQVRMQGIERPLHTGLYGEIKPQLPQGVGYTQVLITYVPELKEFVSLNLTVGLQHHLKLSIAKATNSPVKKINLFNLCDLTSQYWGFRFTGGFSKVDKDGNQYSGAGDMFFMPDCEAFVINEKPELSEQFDLLNGGSEACSIYVQAEQDRIYGATPVQREHHASPMENAATIVKSAGFEQDDSFPVKDITSNPETDPDMPF